MTTSNMTSISAHIVTVTMLLHLAGPVLVEVSVLYRVRAVRDVREL